MKDLTKGSILLHILTTAAPATISLLVQSAHQVVTLHFVSAIGADALAGVSAAGNVGFMVSALGQILNVGAAALVAHSAGRQDLRQITMLHNQAFGLGLLCALATVCVVVALAPSYMAILSSDDAVIEAGVSFLWWVCPGIGLIFPMTVVSATLRGIGVISAPMLIFAITIVLDAAFAAVLIPGWGFIPALGVEGAALASTLSLVVGMMWMQVYFHRTEPGIAIHRKLLRPRLATCRQILALGLPAAAEFTLMFLSICVVYVAIRSEGASAQAGFGIGFRVLQLLILPGLAVSLAAAPIGGQSFGAGHFSRVKALFRTTLLLSTLVMMITTALVQWHPEWLLRFFVTDAAAADTATSFLRIMAWTLVAQGVVYTCAFMFQALGNTLPALVSAIVRFVVFAAPALWLAQLPGFRTEQIWYVFTASLLVQAVMSLSLLHIEFTRKLQPAVGEIRAVVVPAERHY